MRLIVLATCLSMITTSFANSNIPLRHRLEKRAGGEIDQVLSIFSLIDSMFGVVNSVAQYNSLTKIVDEMAGTQGVVYTRRSFRAALEKQMGIEPGWYRNRFPTILYQFQMQQEVLLAAQREQLNDISDRKKVSNNLKTLDDIDRKARKEAELKREQVQKSVINAIPLWIEKGDTSDQVVVAMHTAKLRELQLWLRPLLHGPTRFTRIPSVDDDLVLQHIHAWRMALQFYPHIPKEMAKIRDYNMMVKRDIEERIWLKAMNAALELVEGHLFLLSTLYSQSEPKRETEEDDALRKIPEEDNKDDLENK